MYKFLCPECKQYNYSASKTEEMICSYCGKALKKESEEVDDKSTEKLA